MQETWVGKIPWRRKCQPTPVFSTGKSRSWLQSMRSQSQTRLSIHTHTLTNAQYIIQKCRHQMEKAMASHSSSLAWRIPWTEEPGRLHSMGMQSQTWLSDFTFTFKRDINSRKNFEAQFRMEWFKEEFIGILFTKLFFYVMSFTGFSPQCNAHIPLTQ